MYKVYDEWPEIAHLAYESQFEKIEEKNIDHIVFAGMGGSGSVGDVFTSILSKNEIHISNVKGFHLPSTVNKNTLVITTSVSGNTLEALTILKKAKKKECKMISFSSGGKMKNFCEKNKINHKTIVQVHSPRASFPNYFYSMLNALEPILPTKKKDILDSIKQLEKLRKNISSENLSSNNKSLDLANWIAAIPIIYYPYGLKAAAVRFKNSLQENAKMHTMTEDIVEGAHNGIVAWEKKSNVQPIIIQGKDDYLKTKQLQKIIMEYFKIQKIDFRVVSSPSGSILSKLIYLIYLLDYSSIYKAILNKTDPGPVRSIQFIKNKFV